MTTEAERRNRAHRARYVARTAPLAVGKQPQSANPPETRRKIHKERLEPWKQKLLNRGKT